MFEHNIPDTYTGTTTEDTPGIAGGDFSLSSIDFTRDFTIESHRGSSADDPGYISFRDQDGNVMSRFLDVYVDNFSLRCKHSPYNNDSMGTAAFSLTPDMLEPSALLQESHSTQNNVEVQVAAHDCPPCNQVPAEEVASQPSFLSRIIQAFLWLFTSSSTTNTTEDTKCDSSDNSKCASASSESLEQGQEEVEAQPSALMSTTPIATEPQNAVVNQEHSSEVQVESLVVAPEPQHTDVAVLEDTTETIIDELIYVEHAVSSANAEELETQDPMLSSSHESDTPALDILPLQESETLDISNVQDSQSTVAQGMGETVSISLKDLSQDSELVAYPNTQVSISNGSQNEEENVVNLTSEVEGENEVVETAHNSSIQVSQADGQDMGEGVSTNPEELSFDTEDVEEDINTIGETTIA